VKVKTYQITLGILFAITWGLVLLDRNAITFLFPVLMEEFGLNNAQTGQIVMFTGIGFFLSSLLLTPFADKTGKKKAWLIPLILLTGIFSGGTAIAAGLLAFVIIRFFVGVAEGPLYPLMTSTLKVQGEPKMFATYVGWFQLAIGILAMILGPTITIQLAIHLNWQYSFILISLPTVIVGIIIWSIMREVTPEELKEAADPGTEAVSDTMRWKDVPKVFTYRNCTLSFIANVLVMIGFWGVVSFGTTYWVNEGGLSLSRTGFMSSASGIVSLVWSVVIPILCDRLGRKPSASILTCFIALAMFIIYLTSGILGQLFYILVLGCCGFVSVLFVAIICQESVPPMIAATTTAIGMAIGELFGTAIAPRVLGSIGDMYGLRTIFLVATITNLIAFILTFALKETRKPKIEKQQVDQVSA